MWTFPHGDNVNIFLMGLGVMGLTPLSCSIRVWARYSSMVTQVTITLCGDKTAVASLGVVVHLVKNGTEHAYLMYHQHIK